MLTHRLTSGMRRYLLTTLAASLLAPEALTAQSDWRSVNQLATWVNTALELETGEHASLWFDGHWRRMGVGADPQQVLLRPGLLWRLSPRLQAGAGYAYIATAPYGELAGLSAGREQRSWQQISLASARGDWSLSQRVRWEQRWVWSVSGAARSPTQYQQRARYALRAERPIGGGTAARPPRSVFVYDEFFLPVGHSDAREARLQNRVGGGFGIPVSAAGRVELSYMHQWNRVTPQEAHEFNHTMVISWVWSGRR